MSKHTPGPWEKAEPFATVRAPGRPCIADCGSRSDLDAQANARLIAAAPDLLAALEYIMAWTPNDWNAETARDMARAAIAKARGETA